MHQTDGMTKSLLLLVGIALFYCGSIIAPAVEQLPVILQHWKETNEALYLGARTLGNWRLLQQPAQKGSR